MTSHLNPSPQEQEIDLKFESVNSVLLASNSHLARALASCDHPRCSVVLQRAGERDRELGIMSKRVYEVSRAFIPRNRPICACM